VLTHAHPLAAPTARSGERYPSLKELATAAAGIAERYPTSCRLRAIGRSRSGLPLLLLSAGHGGGNILVTAGPHANEPVGGATVLRLAELLLDHGALLSLPDTVWHFVLCLDPDGARRNEGWLRGPFTVHHYIQAAFRPQPGEQPEWFLGTPQSEAALPETRALIHVIDELRPMLQCSLHGVDFGGAFVQLTRDVPGVTAALGESAMAQGIPLALGAEDAPAWPSTGPGVYVLPAGGKDETGVWLEDASRSTWSYTEQHGGVTAVVESPMWAVDRVSDPAPHSSADTAVKEAADLLRDGSAQVADLLAEVETVHPASRHPLVSAARESIAFGPRLADHWSLEALHDDTVAHVTDVEIMARRVPLRAAAMLSRLLEDAPPSDLDAARARLRAFVAEGCTAIEREFAPRWVPIAQQVEHQARMVLAIARRVLIQEGG
jgi:Zinc carboxypeptidase